MKDGKISIKQLQILMFFNIFGVGAVSFPRTAAQFAGNDGWVLIIGATLFALAYVFVISSLAEMFSDDSFIVYSERIVGRPIGIILSLALAARIILTAGLELRIFGEILKQTMLYKTPFLITCSIMVIAALYLALKSYEARAQLAEILFLIALIPIAIIIASAAINADYTNLLPAFQTHPSNLLLGSFYISMAFRGIELTLLVYPLVQKPLEIKKGSMRAIFAIGMLMLITTVVTLLKFGPEDTKAQLWPVIQMMDAINLPSGLLDRQDALILGIWVVSIFISISAGIFFPTRIMKDAFKKREDFFVLPCAAIILIISQMPENIVQTYKWLTYLDLTIGIAFMLFIPFLLFVIARLRGMGREKA